MGAVTRNLALQQETERMAACVVAGTMTFGNYVHKVQTMWNEDATLRHEMPTQQKLFELVRNMLTRRQDYQDIHVGMSDEKKDEIARNFVEGLDQIVKKDGKGKMVGVIFGDDAVKKRITPDLHGQPDVRRLPEMSKGDPSLWGEDWAEPHYLFHVGQHVDKTSGYPFPGVIVSRYNNDPLWTPGRFAKGIRYDVRSIILPGLTHIFAENQLERIGGEPTAAQELYIQEEFSAWLCSARTRTGDSWREFRRRRKK